MEIVMLVLGFKAKIQADIKAQAVVECPNCSSWNVLTRMCRKKDRHLYIDGCTIEGTTNRESLDNQYGYLSVNNSFRKTHI